MTDPTSHFDGKRLGNRLAHFLKRVNNALAIATPELNDFDVREIEVCLSVDAGLNIGFSGSGANLDRMRTFTFRLTRRVRQNAGEEAIDRWEDDGGKPDVGGQRSEVRHGRRRRT